MSIRTILKSPLLHFFALAGFIFALYTVLDDGPAALSGGIRRWRRTRR
jgi:hypothetical protein